MNLEIHTKSVDKRRLLEALGKTYAKLLKINDRTGNVFISTKRDVRSGHDADGLTLGVDKEEDDFVFENLVVDAMSMQYFDNATIDYTTVKLKGSQFVISNPNAKSTCGCGSSFSV